MPKGKRGTQSPESFSDDSEGWATELGMNEIAQIMNSHTSWETLMFDDRLLDAGVYEMWDWLREAWGIIEKKREENKNNLEKKNAAA